MYPSDFASSLSSLSLAETRAAIHHLLDVRDESAWMLFGTLPFYPCSTDEEDQKLLKRLRETKNVTMRNDPDGRSRLNVNIFTGDVIVTDFGDASALGNIVQDKLPAIFDKWMTTDLAKSLNCHCPAVKCLGPNVLVKICTIRTLLLQVAQQNFKQSKMSNALECIGHYALNILYIALISCSVLACYAFLQRAPCYNLFSAITVK